MFFDPTTYIRAIAFAFPVLTEMFGGGITFLFFTMMMVLQLLFVWKMMPETKGRSLEDIGSTIVTDANGDPYENEPVVMMH